MKMKRKQTSNGVKSSTNGDLRSESNKLDTKIDTKLETKTELTKSEIKKTDLTSNLPNLQNKSNEKKDKISENMNGTSNGLLTNGLTSTFSKSKESKNFVLMKNSSFKEKKKSANASNNQLSLSTKDESLRNNENDKTPLINSTSNLLTIDKTNPSVNMPNDSSINPSNTTELKSKTNEINNSDLSFKSESSNFKNTKRELDSESSNMTKKKIKTDIESKTTNASTMTESDFLGFAEPGTSIVLEGAVLDEIEGNHFWFLINKLKVF